MRSQRQVLGYAKQYRRAPQDLAAGLALAKRELGDYTTALNTLSAATDFATARNLSLQQSYETMLPILSSYRLSADQLSQAQDVLSEAYANSGLSVDELSAYLSRLGPMSKGGIEGLRETTKYALTLKEAGLTGRQAFMGFEQAANEFSQLTEMFKAGKVSGPQFEGLDRLGGSVRSVIEQAAAGQADFEDFIQALAATDATGDELAGVFSGATLRALRVFISEIRAGSPNLNRYAEALSKIGKTTQDANLAKQALNEQLRQAKVGFQTLADSILMRALPPLTAFIQTKVTPLLDELDKIAQKGGSLGDMFREMVQEARKSGVLDEVTKMGVDMGSALLQGIMVIPKELGPW